MNKHKQPAAAALLMVLLISLALAGVAAGQASGQVIDGDINKAAGDLEIPRGTTVNGDVTVNMGQIRILGVVNGDVVANMGEVAIYGDVSGNVEANMGKVVITGNVTGDVQARMGEVVVEGRVGGNLYTGLGTAVVRGTVGGNVESGLGELRIPGHVAGNVTGSGKVITVSGRVDGDIRLSRGIVELGPSAVVQGRIVVDQGMVRLSPGAQAGSVEVKEELTEQEIDELFRSPGGYFFRGLPDLFNFNIRLPGIIFGPGRHLREFRRIPGDLFRFSWAAWTGRLAHRLLSMFIFFALAALTYTLFPRHTQTVRDSLEKRAWPALLWGILSLLLALPLAVLLAVTIIGIPLILVEFLLLGLAWILGYTGMALFLGGRVLRTTARGGGTPLGEIALGVLILGVIGMVPVAGFLVSLAVLVLAVGAALATRFGTLAAPEGGPGPAAVAPAADLFAPVEAGEPGPSADSGERRPD